MFVTLPSLSQDVLKKCFSSKLLAVAIFWILCGGLPQDPAPVASFSKGHVLDL